MTYTIVPRGRRYWIEKVEEDGSRERVESFDTEDKAVRRLRGLDQRENEIERRNTSPMPSKVRF